MNNGYIPKREPAAHQVAASMLKSFSGCYLYVEGVSDCSFWNNYVDTNIVRVIACDGWSNVCETVKKVTQEGKKCLGVIDRDFRDYADYGDKPDNVFLWDYHDMEMTIFKKGSYIRAINSFDRQGKYLEARNKGADILVEALIATNKIGCLKLAEKKNNFGLKFKNKKKNEIETPDYSKLFDKTHELLDVDKILIYLISWSNNKGFRPKQDFDNIKKEYNAIEALNIDSYLLSNGHDLSQILVFLLVKKLKVKTGAIPLDDFESRLYVAFQDHELQSTSLYQSIKNWCEAQGIELFNSPSLRIIKI